MKRLHEGCPPDNPLMRQLSADVFAEPYLGHLDVLSARVSPYLSLGVYGITWDGTPVYVRVKSYISQKFYI
jgi:hypothetical protein